MKQQRRANTQTGPDASAWMPGMILILTAGGVFAWILFKFGWMPAHLFNATRFILYDQGS
jgi:hypothetical protein